MDGLLLDTEKIYTRCFTRVLARHGRTFDISLKKELMGRSAQEVAIRCVAYYQLDMKPELLMQELHAEQEKEFETSEAMPGAREIVETLGRAKIPMAVATSSRKHFFEIKTHKHRDIFTRMTTVVLGDDPIVKRAKPCPDIYLETAKRLNALPEDCLVLEDSVSGVRAARAANMQAIWIPDPTLNYDAETKTWAINNKVSILGSLMDFGEKLEQFVAVSE